MLHCVVFSPESEDQLVELYRYIAEAASADIYQTILSDWDDSDT